MAYPSGHPSQGAPPYPPNNYPTQGVLPYQPQAAQPYKLTREELRVLKECGTESFYRRCLPFMATLGLGTYYAVHMGYMKAHPNYAAGPKVAFSIFFGYVLGKASYKGQCEEKILRLPGGRLKEQILRSRNPQAWSDDDGVYRDASIAYAMPPYTPVPFRSNEQSTAFEQDSERHHDTFDDSFRIRSGDGMGDSEDLPPLVPPAQSTSYNELRNRNREEYEVRRRQYRSGPIDDHPPFSGTYSSPPPSTDRSSRADAYQSPTASADRLSKSSIYQTPITGLDHSTYSVEQDISNQQKRTPAPRKNFYGDVIEK